jgi:hypothetical protein
MGSFAAFQVCHRKNIIKMTPSKMASQKNLPVSVDLLRDGSLRRLLTRESTVPA